MSGVRLPSESMLPPGPRRELTIAIHELYVAASKPSLLPARIRPACRAGWRRIADDIRRRDDLPDLVSHEQVRAILLLVDRPLVDKPDPEATVRRVHQLWLDADGTDDGTGGAANAPADPDATPAGTHRPGGVPHTRGRDLCAQVRLHLA